jgi:hypothetical protein
MRRELAADFHSMLVYEPGQFFVAHQDSEKDDTMIGTLVVTDASRASLLRAAADRAGCEAVLALADIQETWSAYESEPEYGYRDWDDDFDDEDGDDEYFGNEGDSGEYELEELIDSSVRLTRWTVPGGTWSEDISLTVGDAEVCATTRSADLQPYASEYEGYMGNYGNTLDRWYRRAALVVWPRDRDFTNRAEASPTWALDELGARVHAGDLAGARAAAATLAPFWDTAARAQGQAGFFGEALRTASALDDAETAGMLLRPFRIENLSSAQANVRLIEELGAEAYLRNLLSVLKGNYPRGS